MEGLLQQRKRELAFAAEVHDFLGGHSKRFGERLQNRHAALGELRQLFRLYLAFIGSLSVNIDNIDQRRSDAAGNIAEQFQFGVKVINADADVQQHPA